MKSTLVLFLPLLWALSISAASPRVVQVTQTAKNLADRLTRKDDVPFHTDSKEQDIVINLDISQQFQSIEGFGGAFTDSVAYVFSTLTPELQTEFIDAYFGPYGLNYTLGRLTIGSCDFSVGSYSYNDFAGDYEMTNFSIDHDRAQIIPLIKLAQQARGADQIRFFASPWSPPAWMKTNGYMTNSDMPGLIQTDEIFKSWALYLSKYVTAYEAEGIPIWAMTVQNEPHVAKQFLITYECCGFNATHEKDFLGKYLGPRMKQDHPDLKIMIFDDQKPQIVDFVTEVMSDPEAAQYVWGVAFHWYGDFLQNYHYLEEFHQKFPQLPLLATEATLEAHWKQFDPWAQGQYYAIDIIGDLENWASGWVDWNMLLEWEGGPEHSWGPCDAPIRTYLLGEGLIYNPAYWHMGHFSKFLIPGSVRIHSSAANTGNLQFTSFLRPDKQVVTIVLNVGPDPKNYTLKFNDLVADLTIPDDGIQTLVFQL